MYRLFVGLALPDSLREPLARLCHDLPGARWVDPENFHLTLRFIGEVDRHAAADIDDALQRITSPGFEMSLAGLDVFGNRQKTHALWVGVTQEQGGISKLKHLHNKVESAVVRAGQPPEPRKFKPHVTLARFRNAHPHRIQSFVECHGLFRAGPVTVDRFVLFESHMGKGGSVYEELAEYPLQPLHEAASEIATHSLAGGGI